MIIHEINEKYGVICYSSMNYKYELVYVVCYGLDIKQFKDSNKAAEHFKACIEHAKKAG